MVKSESWDALYRSCVLLQAWRVSVNYPVPVAILVPIHRAHEVLLNHMLQSSLVLDTKRSLLFSVV